MNKSSDARSIMLVENESIDNFINERILKLSGFSGEVNIQNGSISALEYFKSIVADNRFTRLPDFIFLDIYMPVMDGYQFLDSLILLSPVFQNIKIVILTASVNPSDRERSKLYSQVIAHHQKPLTFQILNELNINGNT